MPEPLQNSCQIYPNVPSYFINNNFDIPRKYRECALNKFIRAEKISKGCALIADARTVAK